MISTLRRSRQPCALLRALGGSWTHPLCTVPPSAVPGRAAEPSAAAPAAVPLWPVLGRRVQLEAFAEDQTDELTWVDERAAADPALQARPRPWRRLGGAVRADAGLGCRSACAWR